MISLNQENKILYEKILETLKHDEKFIDNITILVANKISNNEYPLKKSSNNVITDIEENFDKYKILCKVKDILNNLGITQKWLSEKTNIPQSSLNGIVNNTMPCSLDYAFRVCKVMGITIEEGFDCY
jgi:DNA-binding XRE family transcriptional regulator